MVPKTKLENKGICIKDFRAIRNLNGVNIRMIMANLAPHNQMRTKVIYSFKSEIHWVVGEVVDYKNYICASLEEIQAYIKECEQNQFDMENAEVWSKAYLPATRKTEIQGNSQGYYQGNVTLIMFKLGC